MGAARRHLAGLARIIRPPGRANSSRFPAVWQELVRTLAEFEPVHILAGGEAVWREAESLVGDMPNVTLHDIPTNDVWARDHGPMFLAGPPGLPPALVDWEYNAWGGKYPPFDLRQRRCRGQVAELHRPAAIRAGHHPGRRGRRRQRRGHDPDDRRVPAQSEPQSAARPRPRSSNIWPTICAARKVIWLGGGIVGDDTDGHIDELARFVGPRTVVWRRRARSAGRKLRAAGRQLRSGCAAATDAEGRPLEVDSDAICPGRCIHDGQRLPASYMNFYIANGVVVVPRVRRSGRLGGLRHAWPSCFPAGRFVRLRAVDLAWGLGAFHCITQQQPAARRRGRLTSPSAVCRRLNDLGAAHGRCCSRRV